MRLYLKTRLAEQMWENAMTMRIERGLSRRLLFKFLAGTFGLASESVLAKSLLPFAAYDLHGYSMKTSPISLWYNQPAATWTEALPVGNGRLGAMHFGGMAEEHLQLNESTLWAGGPHNYDHPGAAEVLAEIRRLIFAGKYREAHELADQRVMSQPIGQAPYQTLGDLFIKFDHKNPTDYQRTLDLDSAVSSVSYTQGGVKYTRELIASHPDHVIALHLEADHRGSLNFAARLASPQHSSVLAHGNTLELAGMGPEFSGVPGVVRFAAIARVETKGGKSEVVGDAIRVSGANSATVIIAMATSYKSYQDVSGNPESQCRAHLDAVAHKSFSDLKHKHTEDHQRLFRRVSIDLGSEALDVPTDQQIANFAKGTNNTLPALYFQYGRYLLIACSRPGGQAATLQGLWNDSTNPPWGSKYTININTEMNYWPAETAALSECHEPLFDMISEIAKTGQQTAKTHYNANGWVTHHNTDGWRGAAPIDGASWGLWPMGGAWLCTHLWQHYLFTGDKAKLRHHYELIKGSAEFFLSTLVEHPTRGWLVTNPSTSPENQHPHGSGLCAGATMDMQIIRDLFAICIAASSELGLDSEFRQKVTDSRARLAPMQIGRAGQLQEWLEDWDMDAPEMHHRHVSHLYGLFPSAQITPEQTPELAAAARRTLEIRGDEGTGWSLAWKLNFWARLHDGNHAYRMIKDALRMEGHGGGGVYPNLFDAHPPFQIDGNFGFTSGVVEMLLQSHDQTLHLLPALPDAWPNGEIKGIRARGGVGVDLKWSAGALTQVTLHPDRSLKTVVRYGANSKPVTLHPGIQLTLDGRLQPLV